MTRSSPFGVDTLGAAGPAFRSVRHPTALQQGSTERVTRRAAGGSRPSPEGQPSPKTSDISVVAAEWALTWRQAFLRVWLGGTPMPGDFSGGIFKEWSAMRHGPAERDPIERAGITGGCPATTTPRPGSAAQRQPPALLPCGYGLPCLV